MSSLVFLFFLFIAALFLIIFFAVSFYFLIFFIIPVLFFGAFFAKTNDDSIKKIISLSQAKAGDMAADLGSGDGRLAIALSKAGARTHGYEINPFLVFWSRHLISKASLKGKVFVHWKNFWKQDFYQYDLVVLYGIGYIMGRLEKKMQKELKNGAKVVSHGFKFPNWQPSKINENIYLYEKY